MAKNANLYIRIDQDIKSQVEQLFSSFGITVTDAVNMFLHKALMVGGIPFDIRTPTPNEETIEAIKEVQEMKRNPHLYNGFDSVEELFEELNSDDEI